MRHVPNILVVIVALLTVVGYAQKQGGVTRDPSDPHTRRQAEPLANANKPGLYVRSIDQVLRLRQDEVDLATAVLIVSERWSDMVYGRRYLSSLDKMAREIRDRLNRKRLGVDYRAIPVMNKYLFTDLRFESTPSLNDPKSLFLHTVMDRRRGYGLSLSILYLSLAERLGLPLYGVVVPGHFFVRYDDGRVRFNIEMQSNGAVASDQYYIDRFKVPPSDSNNIYLKNLNNIQTLGCFFNNLGNTYRDVGDLNSSLLAFERAVGINPTLSEPRANLGNIYLKKGLVKKAIDEYLTALQINPNDAKTHNNLGNAYTKGDSFVLALDEYQRAIALDPNFVDAHKNLAIVYARQRMFPEAISRLKVAIDLKPDDADCYSQLGDVYSQINDYELAITQYKKALTIRREFAEPHYGLAVCYNKLGQVNDEIKEYEQVLAIKPDMVAALVNLGNAYFSLNKYNRAIEYYRKAVRVKPDEAMVYYNLGVAYSKSKKHEEAIAAYLRAVEIDPEMGDAHYGLASEFYYAKKYDLAWRHIKTAQKLGAAVTEDQIKAIESRLPKAKEKEERSAVSPRSKSSARLEERLDDIPTAQQADDSNTKSDGAEKDTVRSTSPQQIRIPFSKEHVIKVEGISDLVGTGKASFEMGENPNTIRVEITNKVKIINDKSTCMFAVETILIAPHAHVPVSLFIEKGLGDYSGIKILRKSDLKFHYAMETVKATDGRQYRVMKKPPVREELEINGLFAVQLKVEDERFLLAGPDGASLKKVDDGFILLDGEAYISRGAAYYESGQYMQAISDLTQAIELNPQYAKAYAYRGIAYAYRGNTEEAKNDLVKTVELSPDLKPMVKMASDNFKLDLKLD